MLLRTSDAVRAMHLGRSRRLRCAQQGRVFPCAASVVLTAETDALEIALGRRAYTRPGEPMTTESSGMRVFGVTSAPAPMTQRLPMTAPSSTIAALPMSVSSPIVQLCSSAWCPTVTRAPTCVGMPASVWMTQPSWMLVPAPISIQSLSPRSTALNQTLAR